MAGAEISVGQAFQPAPDGPVRLPAVKRQAESLRKRDTSGTAFPHSLPTLVLGAFAVLITQAQTAPPEMQLEAAIHKEIVMGDLQGAIGQYQSLLEPPVKDRAVAARALLQMGECLDKLGQGKEAYGTYRRVVNEFADQAAIAAEARVRLAAWLDSQPGPRNLRFADGAAGKVPPAPWFVPSLPKDKDYVAELRRDGCRSGVGCAVVLAAANAPRPVGILMQSFSAEAYRGKTVRLRAWLRVEGKDAEDHGQMWLTVARASRKIGFSDNMDDRPVRSADWTPCEITGEIDQDAKFIEFGFMSIGRGRVWVDDVSFEIVK